MINGGGGGGGKDDDKEEEGYDMNALSDADSIVTKTQASIKKVEKKAIAAGYGPAGTRVFTRAGRACTAGFGEGAQGAQGDGHAGGAHERAEAAEGVDAPRRADGPR